MKKIKKLTAAITAAAMLAGGNIGVLPWRMNDTAIPSANALYEEIIATGDCGADGDNLTWTLDSEGTLTISGKGEMKKWNYYENVPWNSYDDNIVDVTIKKDVTNIGGYAFYGCRNLTSITISDSVTSIGDDAFNGCHGLTSITIPDSVTIIGDKAFFGCLNLTSITIPDSVTSIGNSVFGSCTKLTYINVDFDNEHYLSEDGVLFNEDKSILVHYPSSKIGEEYDIPDGVTSIDSYAFYTCKSLTSITIPGSVTSIGESAFNFCDSLTSITIPDSVTTIGGFAFGSCDSLTSITIPDSVTTIGRYAFADCANLTSITISDSVTSIEFCAFYNNPKLISINVDSKNEYYTSEEGVLFNKDKSVLIQYPLGKTVEEYDVPDGVTSIEKYSFYSCKGLTSVTIPYSVANIGERAFYYCKSLTSITIKNPECSIYSVTVSSGDIISDTATIYGYENSTAQAYAEKYDREFVSLGEAPLIKPIFIPGDVDGDGRLNMTDVSYITEYYRSAAVDNESLLTEEQKKAADANCDGLINSYDAYIVTKVYIEYQTWGNITDVSEYIAENFTYKCPTSEDGGYSWDEINKSPVKPRLSIYDNKYEIDKTSENENVVEVSIYADDFDENIATLDFHVNYDYGLKPYYTSTRFGEELKVETVGVAAECLSIVEDTRESIYISLINHNNYYLDGEIIKLYFIIPSDAEQGDYFRVSPKYEQGDMLVCGEDSKAHAYLFKYGLFDGEIYIKENYGTTTTTTTTTITTTTITTTTISTTTTTTTATSTTTPPTTTTVTTTTLPETGYSVIYNYIILAAAAMVIFGIYAILKNREEA